MASVNHVTLLGRIGKQPQVETLGSGKRVVTISIATNNPYKKEAPPEWHRVVAWEKSAEYVGNYAQKGTLCHVQGRLQTRSWDNNEGKKQYITEVVAENIQVVMGGKQQQQQAKGTPGANSGVRNEPPLPNEPVVVPDDGLPF